MRSKASPRGARLRPCAESPAQLFSRRNRATSPGTSAERRDFSELAAARSASALNVATRASTFALPPLRHDARGGALREPRLDLEPARRFGARDAERAADIGEDRLAGAHFTAPLFARHWL